MTLPINIKVRVLPRFPANVVGRTGIAVNKVNGVYYFDLNYPSVPIAPTVPTGSVPYTLMWDSVSGTYTLIPLSSFTYVEAPNDGFTYGRQSLAWSKALNLAGGTMTGNLILNADPSAALGAATKQYVDSHTSGIPSDAPSDSTYYGRFNGTWSNVAPLASPTFTGTPAAPTAAVNTNTTQLATTAFVIGQAYAPLASPTLTGTPAAPTATAGTNTTQLATTAFVTSAIGTPGTVPENSQSANYTTVLADAGKFIYHPATDNNARTFTIAANASVAYAIGTVISFVNMINTLTIAITTDTMTLAGPGTTGSRTLAANGCCTAMKIGTTAWIISGTGLT
jgi:hypothetical protein